MKTAFIIFVLLLGFLIICATRDSVTITKQQEVIDSLNIEVANWKLLYKLGE